MVEPEPPNSFTGSRVIGDQRIPQFDLLINIQVGHSTSKVQLPLLFTINQKQKQKIKLKKRKNVII